MRMSQLPPADRLVARTPAGIRSTTPLTTTAATRLTSSSSTATEARRRRTQGSHKPQRTLTLVRSNHETKGDGNDKYEAALLGSRWWVARRSWPCGQPATCGAGLGEFPTAAGPVANKHRGDRTGLGSSAGRNGHRGDRTGLGSSAGRNGHPGGRGHPLEKWRGAAGR
jgi:hypothetical protein